MAKSRGAPQGKKTKPGTASVKPKVVSPKQKPIDQKKNPKQRRKSPWREIRVALIALIWLTLLVAGFIAYVAHDLPDSDSLTGPKSAPSITLLARDGSTLARFG
ncbi:uncharacterized protein METZ01_LOCUS497623, partial [marine metagenome]